MQYDLTNIADAPMRMQKYLALCLDLASQSTMRFKHGAVLVQGSNIVAVGINQPRTAKWLQPYKHLRTNEGIRWPMHAELACLHNNNHLNFSNATLYVARLDYKDPNCLKPTISRPCVMCLAILRDYNIRKIVYTTEHGWACECITNNKA